MAEISFGGIATGLPTEEIVSSLMAIERRPLDRLEADKEYEGLRLQAYGQFNARLDELRSAVGELSLTGGVRTTAVRLSSQDSVSASSNGASVGSYDIAVIQLAQVQKNVTAGLSSESESLLGTGTFSINGRVIDVSDANNSLRGLRDSINDLAQETGVHASIINDGSPSANFHLVLSGKDASTAFTLDYAFRDEEGNAIDFSETQVRSSQQAIAVVDGIEVVGNSNTLTGVIAGLTISLNNTSEILSQALDSQPPVYKTTTLTVDVDANSFKEKLSTFVSKYNEIMNWIVAGYRGLNDDCEMADKGSEEGEGSLSSYLRGDATINGIKRGLQSILADAVRSSGSLQTLGELGISTQKDGTLLVNEQKLDSVLAARFEDAVKLLAGEDAVDGVMKRFNSYLVEVTSPTEGMYAGKRDRYEDAVKRLDTQIAQKESLMARIDERIRAQFNAMELLVSNLNAQSDYLSRQMGMLSQLSVGENS